MWKRTFLQSALGFSVLLFSSFSNSEQDEPQKPSIVYILADDLGYADVSPIAPDYCKIPTPNIERLAEEGMRFTNAHAGASVSTPTRYGLLTGRYSWRSRLQSGVVVGDHPPLIASERLTVAGLLKKQGYHTAIVGKWHLDYTYAEPETGQRISPENTSGRSAGVPLGTIIPDGPVTRGFDYFFGFHHHRAMKTIVKNDRVIREIEPVEMMPLLTKKAVEYIHKRPDKQPFFLYVPFSAPHGPIVPSREWEGKSGMGKHADFVMQLDWSVGQILKALDDEELTENTLVIFSSDNGTSPNADIDHLENQGHFPVAWLRGHKADIWDGGHKVPFVARWPGEIAPGSVSDETICHVDFMATCADLLDLQLSETVSEDGVSFLPALFSKSLNRNREAIVHHSIQGNFAIRKGRWKLIFCAGSGGWSTPGDKQALEQGLPKIQLYNIKKDPSETTNLIKRHPEVVEELTSLMEEYIEEGRSTDGKEMNNDVEVELWK
ncbi:MAG: arylsulfatase [Bacteroidales bacterium]|nr:arylsulfatase [Bacteroidales bacterium]